MAFAAQDDNGNVANANAYGSVAGFKTYHADRGTDVSAITDTQIEQALVRATDYLDLRFSFVGWVLNNPQSTQWPRGHAYDRDGRLVQGIPEVIKEVTYEYALRAHTAALLADPTRDPSGRDVASSSVTVGPISKSITFSAGGAVFTLPKYPVADQRLTRSGLTVSGRTSARA